MTWSCRKKKGQGKKKKKKNSNKSSELEFLFFIAFQSLFVRSKIFVKQLAFAPQPFPEEKHFCKSDGSLYINSSEKCTAKLPRIFRQQVSVFIAYVTKILRSVTGFCQVTVYHSRSVSKPQEMPIKEDGFLQDLTCVKLCSLKGIVT